MANPIAYNSGTTVSGCINTGTISLAIDNLNYSTRPGNLNWYAGADPINRYLIVSDTYSQGVDTQANSKPTIWATSALTDNELLKWINGLPARSGQSTFGTLADAISWLTGQNKYLISNQHYPQIVTQNLKMNLDASFTSSYPNVGTKWYDLTGSITGATLTNGPVWVSSGSSSYIVFDGTDDWAPLPNTTIGNWTGLTMDCVVYMENGQSSGYPAYIGTTVTSGRNQFIGIHNNTTNHWVEVYTNTGNYEFIGSSIPFQKWYNVTLVYDGVNLKEYVNSQLGLSTSATGTLLTNTFTSIGRYDNGTPVPKGRFHTLKIYDRHLTESELLQNYYKGQLVTSGLTFAVDAGNLISYQGTGNTVYNLTSSGLTSTGTLTNGPTWTYLSGGTFGFDGTNDYVILPNVGVTNLNAFSVSFWARATVSPINNTVYSEGTPSSWPSNLFIIYFGNDEDNGKCRVWFGFPTVSSPLLSTTNVLNGKWYHVTYNQTSTSNRSLYINGVLEANNTTNIIGHTATNAYIGANNDNGTIKQFGQNNTAMLTCYNRALSESEIKQNFEAYRGRFGV